MGIDDFEKLHREEFYYIDKTGLIRDLLNNWGEVNPGLDNACEEAMKQIKDRRYDERLRKGVSSEWECL